MDAQRDPHRLTVGEWRGASGVRQRASKWPRRSETKPEAPAVTARASSLPDTLSVGLLRRSRRTDSVQGRLLAARMLRICLAVRRWAGGGGAIASWGVGAGETQPSSRSTSPFRTAQTTISCLLPNPSFSCMW